jgi:3-hydroxymyristoyl/3-hydroxydecanoyl-(acyl carrier protein) dehydratase
VDEIIAFEGGLIVAARNVPLREPWTEMHFPGNPILPGVFLIEGMAQTCGLLVRALGATAPKTMDGFLAGIKSAEFLKVVRPGARLIYEARLAAKALNLCLFDATTHSGGELVSRAKICLSVSSE